MEAILYYNRMKAYIKALSYALPERGITNEQLVEEFPEWSVDKIANKVGINTRYVAGENETAADLAVKAAVDLGYVDVVHAVGVEDVFVGCSGIVPKFRQRGLVG